jgi:glycine/D-amino acid oxidase-like deaminating enzyme
LVLATQEAGNFTSQATRIDDIDSSYWLEEKRPTFPKHRHSGRVDVAIVGAGVTGCSCALALAGAGLRVRVHEAREVAGGASGRNGGFALRGAAAPYDAARAELGAERAASLWRLTERALERMAELAGDAFRSRGSLQLAADADEATSLRAEYEALREDGFAVEWRPKLEGRLGDRFHGAIFHPPDGSIHPARWVRRLAVLAAEAGAEIREHDRVEALDELEADQVVIATDGYTHGLLEPLDRAVKPTRGQVVVTEPLDAEYFSCPHYSRHGYDYWQQTEDLRLVLGGFRDNALDEESTAEEATTPGIQARLEAFAVELVGRAPKITHRWSGIFGVTEDLLPLAGPVPDRDGLWVACGYSGHGNVLGFACGELVAQAILACPGPELSLFDPARVL